MSTCSSLIWADLVTQSVFHSAFRCAVFSSVLADYFEIQRSKVELEIARYRANYAKESLCSAC